MAGIIRVTHQSSPTLDPRQDRLSGFVGVGRYDDFGRGISKLIEPVTLHMLKLHGQNAGRLPLTGLSEANLACDCGKFVLVDIVRKLGR